MSDISGTNEMSLAAISLLEKMAEDPERGSKDKTYSKERVDKEYQNAKAQAEFKREADAYNEANPDAAAEAAAQQREFFGGEEGLLEKIRSAVSGAYSTAEPYIPTAALGAGGLGLISQLISDKKKGIMDYLPWLLLGGAGGYGVYNQYRG